ncbi:NAD(P)H-binding protein [Microbacterium sp. KSW4-11]|uniref:NAD(P)H-binding protein n=1 Tax=Microbacterium gawkjiense TaxID=3067309 RepID=A0ABU3GDU8_9MICO|nr:NAD(P)H-binding protein [Microbacterium sp. KSW4-11]MDT3317981.1 NAD(P)H-binding protein [Microbacterium sp. KSW4-11]
MTPSRTLIVGSGRIGSRVAAALRDAGGEVWTLRRSAASAPDDHHIATDLSRPLERPLPAVDAVVVTLPPGDDDFLAAAASHLAAALPVAPGRTVWVSSTRVFEGYGDGRPLTEADEPRPAGPRAQQLVDGEVRAVDLLDAVILRPAGIYGPGRDRLIRQVQAGAPVDHERRTNRIHETDVVRTILALLAVDAPPRVVHGTDERHATLGEVVTFLAGHLGVPVPPRGAPGERRGTVLDGALLRSVVGPLAYPTFEDGYGEMLAER